MVYVYVMSVYTNLEQALLKLTVASEKMQNTEQKCTLHVVVTKHYVQYKWKVTLPP